MFHVKANYQNRTLSSQKIWFAQDDLVPQKVQVLNTDSIVLVEVSFNEFKFDPKFEDDAFDMERNMTGYNTQQMFESNDATLWPVEPSYMPEGVYQSGIDENHLVDGLVLELTYDGRYQYTITEERPKEIEVIAPAGEPILLGFTVGTLTQNDQKKILRFSYEGVDFSIMSEDMPVDEMEKVASSVFGQVGK
jgi:hypothetical protein